MKFIHYERKMIIHGVGNNDVSMNCLDVIHDNYLTYEFLSMMENGFNLWNQWGIIEESIKLWMAWKLTKRY